MSGNQRYDREHDNRDASGSVGAWGEDWDLVRLCRDDRERFFPDLMRRHYALVVNMGYRFFSDRGRAEDMAQEVFLKVYHQLDRLRPGKQPFVHWLCRITSNSCRSMYRKRQSEKRNVTAGKVDFWYGEAVVPQPGDAADQSAEAVTLVNETLQMIQPNERMALILSHINELKTREIASVLKLPEYTVRRLLRRAEEKLRKLITQRMLEQNAGI
jgi:RNA polymerase sigma-70 factor, ECF subfamily